MWEQYLGKPFAPGMTMAMVETKLRARGAKLLEDGRSAARLNAALDDARRDWRLHHAFRPALGNIVRGAMSRTRNAAFLRAGKLASMAGASVGGSLAKHTLHQSNAILPTSMGHMLHRAVRARHDIGQHRTRKKIQAARDAANTSDAELRALRSAPYTTAHMIVAKEQELMRRRNAMLRRMMVAGYRA